jgi:sugar fermentation stimulation protein A
MQYSKPLEKGTLLKRYKRFFADINYKGEVITAHLPNTGSLKTVPLKNSQCFFSTSDDPKRKLKYSLELIETESGFAGVNTRIPNIIVAEALENKLIHKNYKYHQAEVKISDKSRIDFVLSKKEPLKKLKYPDYLKDESLDLHFIEVKNVTMLEGQTAYFPDGVSERATKHLHELMKLKELGYSAEVLFTVQRENAKEFSPAKDLDPVYAKTLKEAKDCGVKISAYQVQLNKNEVLLTDQKIKLKL